jgi:hypothetical protein
MLVQQVRPTFQQVGITLRGKTIAFYNIIKAEISKVQNFYGQTNNIERKNFWYNIPE